jgi:hypothetical protein
MTPKEKAKELYWKYYQNISDTSFPEETAKKCALIAVDEILDNLEDNTGKDIKYWQEVKQEIEKL